MQKIATDIHGAWIIEPDVFEDHRGVFLRATIATNLPS